MTNNLAQDLAQFIAAHILKQPTRTITPTEKIISSGLIDSFSLVDLSLHIEETYGVRIDDTELNADTFDSLLELEQLILQRQG